MKQGFMTFIEAAKPRHNPQLWLVSTTSIQEIPAPKAANIESGVDPVELTIMAVNRLGLATFRTATSGRVSTVTVPDARTAEIFRAALREMQNARSTDRLVEITVSGDDGQNAAGSGQRGRDAVKT